MATRKSEDGSRGAPSVEARPGSYVQISGAARRRRAKTQPPGASAASAPEPAQDAASVLVERSIIAGEDAQSEQGHAQGEPDGEPVDHEGAVDDLRPTRPGAAREGDTEDLRATRRGAREGAVRDLRASRQGAATRAPRRPLGPLGMDDPQSSVSPSPPPSPPPPRDEMRTTLPGQPRAKIVEINPPELTGAQAELSADNIYAEAEPPPAAESAAQAPRPSTRPTEMERAADRFALQATHDDDDYGSDEASLSSVLDARPSFRASPIPPREKLSIGWWILIGVFCAMIGSAGAIALYEARERTAAPESNLGGAPGQGPAEEPSAQRTEPLRPAAPATTPVEPAAVVRPELPAAAPPSGAIAIPQRASTPAAEAGKEPAVDAPRTGKAATPGVTPPALPRTGAAVGAAGARPRQQPAGGAAAARPPQQPAASAPRVLQAPPAAQPPRVVPPRQRSSTGDEALPANPYGDL